MLFRGAYDERARDCVLLSQTGTILRRAAVASDTCKKDVKARRMLKMGAVLCKDHGSHVGALLSESLRLRLNAKSPVSLGDLRRFEVDMDGDVLPFWSDLASLKDADLPANRALSMEEFFETEAFDCSPVCPDCLRHWLRENNIDPKDVGLE
jgi:hypothetical protein